MRQYLVVTSSEKAKFTVPKILWCSKLDFWRADEHFTLAGGGHRSLFARIFRAVEVAGQRLNWPALSSTSIRLGSTAPQLRNDKAYKEAEPLWLFAKSVSVEGNAQFTGQDTNINVWICLEIWNFCVDDFPFQYICLVRRMWTTGEFWLHRVTRRRGSKMPNQCCMMTGSYGVRMWIPRGTKWGCIFTGNGGWLKAVQLLMKQTSCAHLTTRSLQRNRREKSSWKWWQSSAADKCVVGLRFNWTEVRMSSRSLHRTAFHMWRTWSQYWTRWTEQRSLVSTQSGSEENIATHCIEGNHRKADRVRCPQHLTFKSAKEEVTDPRTWMENAKTASDWAKK